MTSPFDTAFIGAFASILAIKGESATYTDTSGNTTSVTVIVDRDMASVAEFVGGIVLEQRAPAIIQVAQSSLSSIQQGATFDVGDKVYHVPATSDRPTSVPTLKSGVWWIYAEELSEREVNTRRLRRA